MPFVKIALSRVMLVDVPLTHVRIAASVIFFGSAVLKRHLGYQCPQEIQTGFFVVDKTAKTVSSRSVRS